MYSRLSKKRNEWIINMEGREMSLVIMGTQIETTRSYLSQMNKIFKLVNIRC